ncbi:shikimate kinase [Paenibacillus solisilvae]|uniref:Shikimate kinase n=1 Tax=Paenibacillus solisilvae TaxID=2486751 RepID=A0ABW0W529_9BACL
MEHKQQPHIVLVGFMGTGKSTIGELLAKRLGCDVIGIDEEIERRAGKRIPEIFASKGETAFREGETEALRDALQSNHRRVISTGGGAVLAERNRELMITHGLVIALKADAEQIIARVSKDSSRPLLQGDVSERVHKLLEDRKYAYDFAHKTIDTTQLSVDDVVDQIWNYIHH